MQTKNAIGNLINRYRAVLKKCNLLNTFGTLALASALAMSGAGLASADDVTSDNGVTVTTAEDAGNHGAEFATGTDDLNVTDKDTTITNVTGTLGTVTINASNNATALTFDGSAQPDEYSVQSGDIILNGNANKATLNIDAMHFMLGDTINGNTIKGDSTNAGNQEVNILDGLVSGQTGNSMLLNKLTLGDASSAVTVNVDAEASLIASELDVVNGSALNADGTFNIYTGGDHDFSQDDLDQVGLLKLTVTKGTVKADTINVIGSNTHDNMSNAEGIDLTTNGALDTNKIIVENSAIKGDYTLIGTGNTGLKALDIVGASKVDGGVTVNGGTLTAKEQPVADGDTKAAIIRGAFTVADGAVNIAADGDLEVQGGAAVSGGTVDVAGTLVADNTGAGLAQTGGTINVAENGFFHVKGTADATMAGADASHTAVLDNKGIAVFDKNLSISNNSSVFVNGIQQVDTTDDAGLKTAVEGAAQGTLIIDSNNGAELNGTDAVLGILGDYDGNNSSALTLTSGELAVKGTLSNQATAANVKIEANKYVHSGGDLTLNGGLTVLQGIEGVNAGETIKTASGAKLELGVAESDTDLAEFFGEELMAAQGGTIAANLATNGAAIEVEGGDWTLADIALGASAGELRVNGGNITDSGNITSAGSDLEVLSGGLTAASIDFSSGAGAITFGSAGNTTTVNVTGDVKTGSGDFTIAGDDDTKTTVALGGDLTLNGAMVADGGKLTVTGAFDSATSAANAVSIGANKKTVVELNGDVTTSDNSANNSAVTLGQLGTLKVKYDQAADGSYAKKDNWSDAFDAASKGTLILTGAETTLGGTTISLANYDILTAAVLGTNGGGVELKLDSITIDTNGSTLDQIVDKDRKLSDNVIAVADGTPVTVGTDTTVKALDASAVTNTTAVTVGNSGNGTLTLAGFDSSETEEDLVKGGGEDLKLAVTGDGTLQLGIADETGLHGTLGKTVTVADNSGLNAVNGEFSIKEIAVDTTNGSTVGSDVSLADAVLTVSEGDVQVNSVEKTSGETGELIAAAGNISVATTVDGAALTAENTDATINVTGAVSNGAALTADGDITTGNTVADSTITSANGNIDASANTVSDSVLTAENGDITVSTAEGGSLSAANGTITATGNLGGNTAVESITAKKLDAQGTVDLAGGELNLTGTDTDASTVAGAFTAAGMTGGNVAEITFSDAATIKDGSTLDFGKVTMANAGSGDLTIGDSGDTDSSAVTIENLALGNNTLKATSSAGNTAVVAVGGFDDGTGTASNVVNGLVQADANGIVVLGGTDTAAALQDVTKTLTMDDGTTKAFGTDYAGAVYIAGPMSLDAANGGIAAGTGQTATAGQIDIASDGLMVVNGANADPAVSDVDGTKVTIAGAVNIIKNSGGDVTLFSGTNLDETSTTNITGDFFTNNKLLSVTGITQTADAFVVSVAADTTNNPIYSGFSDNLGALVGAAANAGTNDFINSVANNVSEDKIAATIEGAAKAPMIIGAPKIALDVATMGSDYAMARTSFAPRVAGAYAMDDDGQAQNIASGDNMANGMNVWIMPMYEHSSVDGLDSGLYDLSYDNDFYGLALGADYTWDNSFRLGATINMGTGDAETKSGSAFGKTENDYDSLGVGLYAGYMIGNFGVSGDLMYTHVKNDIDQKVAGFGTISAEGDTDVVSVGLRGEYKIETSAMDIIPHAGVRFNHIDMDDMNFSGVLSTEAENANIWQLPVGVTFTREVATESGWNIKPSLDLSIIPALGDTDMAQSVRFNGVSGLATMNTEIMDELSGRAQVGVEATKGNFYMGLDYAYQGSSNIDAHQVQANFGFKF